MWLIEKRNDLYTYSPPPPPQFACWTLSHSMKNLVFYSSLRWKMIMANSLTTSPMHLSIKCCEGVCFDRSYKRGCDAAAMRRKGRRVGWSKQLRCPVSEIVKRPRIWVIMPLNSSQTHVETLGVTSEVFPRGIGPLAWRALAFRGVFRSENNK